MEYDEQELLEEARFLLESKSSISEESQLICECNCISVDEIRLCLNGREPDIDILSNELNLGSGCSSCIKSFDQWKRKV